MEELIEILTLLEKDCIGFDMTKTKMQTVINDIIIKQNNPYIKLYQNSFMTIYDRIGIKVEAINDGIYKVKKIYNPNIKYIKVNDIIINYNNLNVLDGNIKENTIIIKSIRDFDKDSCEIIKETINLPPLTEEYNENVGKIAITENENYIKIKIKSFNFNFKDIDKIKNMENINELEEKILILDLRGNLGGSVKNATLFLEYFLKKNSIAYYVVNKKNIEIPIYISSEFQICFKNIFILVDNLTMSAAEIVCCSMKDNLNAIILGQQTFGKGVMQKTIKVYENLNLVYPKFKYLSPLKYVIDKVGITPLGKIDELKKIIKNILID